MGISQVNKPQKDKVVLARELPNLKALSGPFLWECPHSQLHSAKFVITAFPRKLVLVSPTADRFSPLVGKNSHLVGRRGHFGLIFHLPLQEWPNLGQEPTSAQ